MSASCASKLTYCVSAASSFPNFFLLSIRQAHHLRHLYFRHAPYTTKPKMKKNEILSSPVSHDRKPCKNGWTDRDVVYSGPKEPCIRWGSHWRYLANTSGSCVCGLVSNYFDSSCSGNKQLDYRQNSSELRIVFCSVSFSIVLWAEQAAWDIRTILEVQNS